MLQKGLFILTFFLLGIGIGAQLVSKQFELHLTWPMFVSLAAIIVSHARSVIGNAWLYTQKEVDDLLLEKDFLKDEDK